MITDIFSKRQARLEATGEVVYGFTLPPGAPIRQQVLFLFDDALASLLRQETVGRSLRQYTWADDARKPILHEYGETSLTGNSLAMEDVYVCVRSGPSMRALDVIEQAFAIIDTRVRALTKEQREEFGITLAPDEAIAELNHRFHEHAIGYQFASGQLIRVDSQYLHQQVVVDALSLLSDARFKAAKGEFLAGHEHYRHGRYESAIQEALKAFESTLKVICSERNWAHDPHATASKLIDVVFANDLLPSWVKGEFTSLQALLTCGTPTVRNKSAGHGAGVTPRAVPDYLAAFTLHSAAANIVLLAEAFKALP